MLHIQSSSCNIQIRRSTQEIGCMLAWSIGGRLTEHMNTIWYSAWPFKGTTSHWSGSRSINTFSSKYIALTTVPCKFTLSVCRIAQKCTFAYPALAFALEWFLRWSVTKLSMSDKHGMGGGDMPSPSFHSLQVPDILCALLNLKLTQNGQNELKWDEDVGNVPLSIRLHR